MKGKSTKDILLEHSKAKVSLYVKYLSKYLNIMQRAGFAKKIHLYDLMCGEGIYSDDSKGSPIRALETIKDHYFSNDRSCIDMEVWLNDFGNSDVEEGRLKIERVEEACGTIFTPNNVELKFTNLDYVNEIHQSLIEKIKSFDNEKLVLFLDPHGYKDITPKHIKEILCNNVELLLFVPITQMYRFANKSLSSDEFKGGESLAGILKTLLNGDEKTFENEQDFISTLKEKYREYLNDDFFVDTFTIQRNSSNTYALFFFTPHVYGFETMLKTKWEMDEKNGLGFKIKTNQLDLFEEVSFSKYPEQVKEFLKKGNVTNIDLYIFGLRLGYLPRHTNEILKGYQKMNPNFIVKEGNNIARKGAFYIGYNYYKKMNKIVNFYL